MCIRDRATERERERAGRGRHSVPAPRTSSCCSRLQRQHGHGDCRTDGQSSRRELCVCGRTAVSSMPDTGPLLLARSTLCHSLSIHRSASDRFDTRQIFINVDPALVHVGQAGVAETEQSPWPLSVSANHAAVINSHHRDSTQRMLPTVHTQSLAAWAAISLTHKYQSLSRR